MTTRADRRGLVRRAILTRNALPFSLTRYAVYQLPAASLWTGAHVFVTDDVGGPVEAFSDGTNWRRVTDLAIVSAVTTGRLYAVGASTATFDAVAGPYLVARGAATGIMVGAWFSGGALSAAGATVATLATPPKVTGDLSAVGAATGTLTITFGTGEPAGLRATGAAVGTLVGAAA